MTREEAKKLYVKRVIFYWASLVAGYIFPLVYFFITAGITRKVTRFVVPTLIACIFLVVKLASDIPRWTSTWRPSLAKGLLIATPKFLIFIILISLGLVLKYIIEKQIELHFFTYFETVLVFFGGQSVGAFLGAFHLKYKQLDMIHKGYVLGVVNK